MPLGRGSLSRGMGRATQAINNQFIVLWKTFQAVIVTQVESYGI
jgi:hypothetical protein